MKIVFFFFFITDAQILEEVFLYVVQYDITTRTDVCRLYAFLGRRSDDFFYLRAQVVTAGKGYRKFSR